MIGDPTRGPVRGADGSWIGAHVSSAGGVQNAPGRGAELDASVIQLFTKQVNRWAEPRLDPARVEAFRAERDRHGIRIAGSHDSYLINLASPDPELRERSYGSFRQELERSRALELDFVVTHPGNATDGDRAGALERNAEAIRRALLEVPGCPRVLLEGTAGQGTALAAEFEELERLLREIGPDLQDHLGVCLDTAHLFAAGYDIVADYDGVMARLDEIIGLDRIRLWHLNDSKAPFGSRVDRHEDIARGRIGPAPFERLVRDERFRAVPKVIETPKGEDAREADLRNLRWLRRALSGD